LSRVKNGKTPIINEDGRQTRDFVQIQDIVNACELTLENDAANNEVFNVGSGVPTTINEVARVVLSLYGKNSKPEITGKFRTFDVRHCFADTSKLKKLIGWEPTIDFKTGMNDVFKWSINEKSHDLVESAIRELEKRGLR
jgi:dTDP-L-rhamnose 4-epimerase